MSLDKLTIPFRIPSRRLRYYARLAHLHQRTVFFFMATKLDILGRFA
jgi:hypothetical protein